MTPCKKKSDVNRITVATGIEPPSRPKNVSADQDEAFTVCTVNWGEPSINFNNISTYQISYTSENRDNRSLLQVFSDHTKHPQEMIYEINMTKPNSVYNSSVTAVNCAGESESAEAIGNCYTDAAAPDSVPGVLFRDGTENAFGTIEVFGTFQTIIPTITQENGKISCYYIVMVRYDKLYDASTEVKRIQPSEDELELIATATEDVDDGQLYFAAASDGPGIVTIGDGTISACSNESESSRNSRSSSYKYVTLNRNLTLDRSYDMFLLTTVPSVISSRSNVYSKFSDGAFFNVLPITVSSTVTETESAITESNVQAGIESNLVAILVPVIVVFVILLLGTGYCINRKRKNWKKSNSKDPDDNKCSNEIHLYEEISDPSNVNLNDQRAGSTKGYENVLLDDRDYDNLKDASKQSDKRYETVILEGEKNRS